MFIVIYFRDIDRNFSYFTFENDSLECLNDEDEGKVDRGGHAVVEGVGSEGGFCRRCNPE